MQEGEEKMHIEYAMKKMSYENKIRELEETVSFVFFSNFVPIILGCLGIS